MNESWSPVLAVRVDRSGTVLDREPVAVAEGWPGPAVSCGGESCLVIPAACFPRQPCSARVRLDGDRIEHAPIERAGRADAVAFDGEHHVAVRVASRAREPTSVLAAWLTPEGVDAGFGEVEVTVAASDTDVAGAHLACGAGRCLVAWTVDGQVKAARVAAGEVLDPDGLLVAEAPEDDRSVPRVARVAGGYAVAWIEGDWYPRPPACALVRTTVGDDGVVGPAAAAPDPRWCGVAVSSDGVSAFAVLSDGGDVFGLDLEGDGEPLLVSAAAPDQDAPVAASDGEGHLVLWEERAGGSWPGLRAARVLPSGEVVDPGGIDVAGGPEPHGEARLAWSGAHHVAVWRRGTWVTAGDTMAARIDATDGRVLDEGGVVLEELPPVPALSCSAGACLAAWPGGGRCGADLRVAPIEPEEDWRAGTARAVRDSDNRAGRWAIAPDGDGYLLVWQEERLSWPRADCDPGPPYSFAAHVTAGGGIGEVHELPGGAPGSLAAGAAGFLVVWDDSVLLDEGTWEERSEIHGLRMGPGGAPLDEDPIEIAAGLVEDWHLLRRDPVAAFDGESFAVVWRDGREGGMDDLFAARVLEDGTVEPPGGFAVSRGRTTFADEPDEAPVALSADADGRLLLAYRRFDPRPPHGSHRIHARLLRLEALAVGEPCAGDWECLTGACAAGACCERPCRPPAADAGPAGDGGAAPDGGAGPGPDAGAGTDVGRPPGARPRASADAGVGFARGTGRGPHDAAGCGCDTAGRPRAVPGALALAPLFGPRRRRRRPRGPARTDRPPIPR